MANSEVRSPLPGVFYRKPAPDQPNYVEAGDTIAKGDVVGLVEVMKTFHEVKSEFDGVVGEFSIDHEDAVMAGQVLFVIND